MSESVAFAPIAYTPRPTMRQIATEVAERHGLTLEDLQGPRVWKRFVAARHEAMWTIRQRTNFSFPAIGKFFSRDHTTAQYAVRAHGTRLASELYEKRGGCSPSVLVQETLTNASVRAQLPA